MGFGEKTLIAHQFSLIRDARKWMMMSRTFSGTKPRKYVCVKCFKRVPSYPISCRRSSSTFIHSFPASYAIDRSTYARCVRLVIYVEYAYDQRFISLSLSLSQVRIFNRTARHNLISFGATKAPSKKENFYDIFT